MSDVRAAIEANNRKFGQAFHHRDAAAVAALYSENAHILPPGSEMMQGRAAIQAFWQAQMDSGVKEVELETVDVEFGGGTLATEIGHFVLTIQQGSETVKSSGKYAATWKQEGEDWKLHVDIWNSSSNT
ncbi:MAG: SgcJ/EcaC family oxidoreductase [Ktedonobacteraceae bacterium]|nr:SgcJ/EcaC family oxidoreductase [Ktedonobacteraceae bacterium]